MTKEQSSKRHIVNTAKLPQQFPTHLHDAEFWETLGRVVATFGFLEETLCKAIFAFTATREYPADELEAAYQAWLPTLERALADTLGNLVTRYAAAVRDNEAATITNLDDLVKELRQATTLRNVLCHGSWRAPDDQGRSIPFFVDREQRIFQDRIDTAYLQKIQTSVTILACEVVNTVTHMGWQFPGSEGPGLPIVRQNQPAR